ncbi:hypothetical protein [Neolewinella sp.]|uniref:hypothetical protein n=1 Tax=Neolewinella sp. TaxID=2993543 RepID=UPI003B51CA0C
MHHSLLLAGTLFVVLVACSNPQPATDPAADKAAVLATLNAETVAAFSRDYDAWQDKWVHEPYVTKTYMNFADSSMTETLGWAEVDQFVVDYFAAHPDPDPLPTPLRDIDVRLYGSGAHVSYEQDDPARGRKRETRLMERVGNEWKIAGMETVTYGTRTCLIKNREKFGIR